MQFDISSLNATLTGSSAAEYEVGITAIESVVAWSATPRTDAQWATVSQRSLSRAVVRINTTLACIVGEGYPQVPLSQEFRFIATLSENEGRTTAQYTTYFTVNLRIDAPVLVFVPKSASQLFVSSTGEGKQWVVFTNTGNADAVIRSVSIAAQGEHAHAIERNATTDSNTIAAGESVALQLSSRALSAPPDVYEAAVLLDTNVPQCSGASRTVYSLPWTTQVASVLVFPTSVSAVVRPHQADASVCAFSLLNFVGEPVRCQFDVLGSSLSQSALRVVAASHEEDWVQVTSSYVPVPPGELVTVEVGVRLPGNVTCGAEHGCTSIPTQWFALQSRCYKVSDGSVLNVANLTVHAAVQLGTLSGGASTAQFYHAISSGGSNGSGDSLSNLTVATKLEPGTSLRLEVVVRDESGQVNFGSDSTLGSLTVSAAVSSSSSSSSAAPSQRPVSVTLVNANNVTGALTLDVSMPRNVFGNVVFVTSLDGAAIPGGSAVVEFVQPNCTDGFVLDAQSGLCVCEGGRYLNVSVGCVSCEAGTYKRYASNGSVTDCVPCTTGWYCRRGSTLPTGTCPGNGFHCTSGKLAITPGYWVHNRTALLMIQRGDGNSSASALGKCPLRDACAFNEGGCAVGYNGTACTRCADGYAFIRFRCIPCVFAVVGGWLLLAYMAAFVLIGGTMVALAVQVPGTAWQRQMWVASHGSILHTNMGIFVDLLQLLALQAQIPSQLPSAHVVKLLSVTGLSLGPGTWPPTLCLFTSKRVGLLFPLLFVAPATLGSLAVSVLMSPVLWKRFMWTPGQLWQRCVVSLRMTTWALLPGIAWGVINAVDHYSVLIAFA